MGSGGPGHLYILSPLPVAVAGEVVIELPRPRTRELLAAPRFIAYRQELLRALGL